MEEQSNLLNIVFETSYDYKTADGVYVANIKVSLPAENRYLVKNLQSKHKMMNENMTELWGKEGKITGEGLPEDVANRVYRTMEERLRSVSLQELRYRVAERKRELIAQVREIYLDNQHKLSRIPEDSIEVIPISDEYEPKEFA